MAGGWFLVHAKAGQERLAESNLKRQGFATFMPALRRTVSHARRSRLERVALFPGYLFVAMDPERDPWRRIDSTLGVVRIVTAMDRPLRAPDRVVFDLLDLADSDGVVDATRSFAEGDAVSPLSGPLSGRIGQVQRLSGADRIRVLFELMGGPVAVNLHRADLAAA